jgi:hypothetical protein
MNPVRDTHESRRCANYWCQTPAKSLSQYASSERFLFGFMMSGLSLVHCKYQSIMSLAVYKVPYNDYLVEISDSLACSRDYLYWFRLAVLGYI